MTTASWGSQTPLMGGCAPGGTDDIVTTQAGVSIGPPVPVGTLRQFVDLTGKYGSGTFIYLPGVASLAVGDVCSYNLSAGVAYTDATVVRWAGTANTGEALAVASAANTSSTKFSWMQVQGATVCNTSGTIAAGDAAFFASTATLKTAAVAGKQVIGAKAFSANGVPAANQAIYTLDFPAVQTQIT